MRRFLCLLVVLFSVAWVTPSGGLETSEWNTCEQTPECVAWIEAVAINAWYEGLIHNHPFLVCTRDHESRGDYSVVSSNQLWYGAYQFELGTWDSVASRHRPWLVGSNPALASVGDQDFLALKLYEERDNQPWGGRC